MNNKINYIPSWLDGAYTLLQKLDKCIEKIEGFNKILETYGNEHNEIKQIVEELDNKATDLLNQITDVLSLAQTNESDIGVLDGQVAQLETKIPQLENSINTLSATLSQLSIITNQLQMGGVVHNIGGSFVKNNEEFSFSFISRPMNSLTGRTQVSFSNYVNRRNVFNYGFISLRNNDYSKVYWGQVISVEVDSIISPSKVNALLINGMSKINGIDEFSVGASIPFGSEDGQFSIFVDSMVGE